MLTNYDFDFKKSLFKPLYELKKKVKKNGELFSKMETEEQNFYLIKHEDVQQNLLIQIWALRDAIKSLGLKEEYENWATEQLVSEVSSI